MVFNILDTFFPKEILMFSQGKELSWEVGARLSRAIGRANAEWTGMNIPRGRTACRDIQGRKLCDELERYVEV